MRSYTFELRRKFKKTVSENSLKIEVIMLIAQDSISRILLKCMVTSIWTELCWRSESLSNEDCIYKEGTVRRLKVTTEFHLR